MGPCCSKKDDEEDQQRAATSGTWQNSTAVSEFTASRTMQSWHQAEEKGRVAKVVVRALNPESLAVHILATDMRTLAIVEIDNGMSESSTSIKGAARRVPRIEMPDGFVVSEASASLRFLSRSTPRRSIYYPSDEKLQGRIDWAMAAAQNTVRAKWRARMGHMLGFAKEPANNVAATRELKDVIDKFGATFIGAERFIAGETMSIADYAILPYLYSLNRPIVEKKFGIKLSHRLQDYVKDAVAASSNAELFLGVAGNSIGLKLDRRQDRVPDFVGEVTILGGQECAPMQRGDQKEGEKQAQVWGLAASTNTASAVLLARQAGIGDLHACPLKNLEETVEWKKQLSARNPFHTNPTLVASDGYILGETTAILRHIARCNMPELYPVDFKVQSVIDRAMEIVDGQVTDMLGYRIVFPLLGFAQAPANQAEANDQCRAMLLEFAAAYLPGGRRFVAGDHVSIAEYRIVPFLFAASRPEVLEATDFVLPAPISQYLQNCLAAIGKHDILFNADGYSIQEVLQKRAKM